MLRNYLQIAIRNLRRNPLYSLLNIGGLATGLAVSTLILLYVVHEYSFDNFQTNGDRIFQVLGRLKFGEQTVNIDHMSAQLGPRTMQAGSGLVEGVVRMRASARVVVKTPENFHSFEDHLSFADPSFFQVFTFPLSKGNPLTALQRPNTIVLSPALALKYFGTSDPIGKTLVYGNKLPLEVTGVFEELPSNTILQFDGLISFDTQNNLARTDEDLKSLLEDTQVSAFATYFLLRSSENQAKVSRLIAKLSQQDSRSKDITKDEYLLEKLTELHLHGTLQDHSQQFHRLFLGVALAILALALINYMNLTTARATQRAKEVGVRKVLGGLRSNLTAQFYAESVLITVIAFGISLLLVEILRPVFFQLLDLRISDSFLRSPIFLFSLLGLLVVTTLLAGSYPALLLSRFAPVEVLKGRFSNQGGGIRIRQSLTIFQFSVSVGLIICSLVIKHQLEFLRTKNIGLDKAGIVVLELPTSMSNHYLAFKQELRQQTGIQSVSAASWPLFKGGTNAFYTQSPITKKDIFLPISSVDDSFFTTMDVPWKIKPSKPNYNRSLIINEAALKEIGFTESPIGQKLQLGKDPSEIVGVIKDFNLYTSKLQVGGLGLTIVADTTRALMAYGGCLYLKLAPGSDVSKQLASIESIFKKYETEYPFEYYFLDEAYDALYKAEAKLGTMLSIFTGVAILIACLGLFGLATFAVETRRKEIGIRKVLGASLSSITFLLSKEFLKLVLIANGIAFPIAWYFMQEWLKDYSSRIEIGWISFALAGFMAVVIAFITVSSQAIRAANADPVKSLKNE
ncbi:MAG: ABC transporter permease [Siphonobacter sp.]